MRRATTRETCIGPNGNEPYVPVQDGGAFAGQQQATARPTTDGVSYNDFTPRWGVAWDLFGTGKTSVKLNMGKYLCGRLDQRHLCRRQPGPASGQRATRGRGPTWTATAVADCDLLNFNAQTMRGRGYLRWADLNRLTRTACGTGRDPLSLDEAGTPIGLATTQCGRKEKGIPAGSAGLLRRLRRHASSMGPASAAPSGSSASASSTRSCRACLPR